MKKRMILAIVLLILIFVNLISSREIDNKIKIKNNTIEWDSLTLRQKIAQMFIVRGNKENLDLTEFDIGGIILGEFKTKENYKKIIREYQNKSDIKLFISADLEGYWNPFQNFAEFPNLDEINTKEESYNLGRGHGELLKELGFNLNFAPVAEIEDNVWRHRAFLGNSKEISEKVSYYAKGIQEQGIKATVKHYPGGSLNLQDPHLYSVKSEISNEQLKVFDSVLENISAVMVGHAIVFGAENSNEKPSSVSPELISRLREKFEGLVISDDINMKSLRKNYFLNEKQLLIDLINAGNDILIDGSKHIFPKYNLNKKINYIQKAVNSGKIKEEVINESVKRILREKGYNLT